MGPSSCVDDVFSGRVSCLAFGVLEKLEFMEIILPRSSCSRDKLSILDSPYSGRDNARHNAWVGARHAKGCGAKNNKKDSAGTYKVCNFRHKLHTSESRTFFQQDVWALHC